jgi:hypothetical protein
MTTIGASRSFPTLKHVFAPFRWLFRNRWRVLTAAAVLLAMIAAPVVWWFIQLLGLPDIGDPFDVEAFRSLLISEDRNAFVLYRQAVQRLVRFGQPMREHWINLSARWSKADPRVRRWVEANHEAMELYRRGTERPDAFDPQQVSDPNDSVKTRFSLESLEDLALLEASRLEEAGEMETAWGWYRTALRGTYHLGLQANIIGLGWSPQSRDGEFRGRLSMWAADHRTTPDLIRRALDDVVACGQFVPSESNTLKAEYLSLVDTLKDPYTPLMREIMAAMNAKLQAQGYYLDKDRRRAIAQAWWFWRREKERSRRVIRLAVANWLASFDLPPDRRPAPDPGVTGPCDFYAFGPDFPEKARAISPKALDRWMKTTQEAQEILPLWVPRTSRVKQRVNHRALIVLLASELYRRDHGTDPPTDEALVGPYLKSLPDDVGEEAVTRGSTGQE